MAVDLDLSLVDADVPGLELRQGDIVAGPVAPGDFDLVTARAVLHHVADVTLLWRISWPVRGRAGRSC